MIKSYKDLKVWQKGRELVRAVYVVTESFPKKEQYRLADQLCRAVVSVPSNIAEGSSRRSTQEYIRFVNIAFGSLVEVETQLILAMDLGYISEKELNTISNDVTELAKMLNALLNALTQKTLTPNITKLQTLNSKLS